MATHLCVRSSYSLLNGTMRIQEIIDTAQKYGFKQIALTDYQVLYGALDFQLAAQKAGIKAIFGIELEVHETDTAFKTLVLARNNVGFQSLISFSERLSRKETINIADLASQQNNLVVIMYSEQGPFEHAMFQDDWGAVQKTMDNLMQTFTDFYVGISHQESEFFHNVNPKLEEVCTLNGVQTLALSKVYYRNQQDEKTLRILNAIDKQTYLEDRTLTSAPHRHFLTSDELESFYTQAQLELSDTIAGMCHVDLLAMKTTLPSFPTPSNVDSAVYLKQLSHFGLKKRLQGKVSQAYKTRLDYELDVIVSMEFEDYFLIVYDVIRFAKQSGIYVGPGRGSAAGSLVAYSLGITEIDPLKYDLLFERFLNPDRISMPDIDIDFPDNRRQEVIDYVRDKYGDDHVAHIVTFGTLKARQAFRDTARVLQVPLHKVDQCTKLIRSLDLKTAYQQQGRFRTLIESDDLLKRCFEDALKIEGLPRHASLHAAGIVLSSQPLRSMCPILHLDDGVTVIQYDMIHVEKLGLVKIDFLGLRNLTLIDRISHDIRKKDPDFNIMNIPLDNKKAYQILSQGETVGIFQLESEGMTKLIRDLKPYQFMDIVDAIALYRPGPMENIPMYLEARSNPKTVKTLHPDLDAITASTHGILIYQEQIMQVAQKMAGFTLAKADILRKAMSKKDEHELFRLKDDFIQGCIQKGYTPKIADAVFALIFKFANYGFNKSHSVAYGLIAYQLAYLKANYGTLFYTHLLNSVIGSDSKTQQYVDECRRRNILLLGVHLESSGSYYRLDGAKIRLPFTIIKGISNTISETIVSEKEMNGKYASYYNAIARLSLVRLNKSHFEALIRAGAFDYFGHGRLSMLASLQEGLRYASLISIKKDDRLVLNTKLISEPIFTVVDEHQRQHLEDEHHVLGFYFSEHPLSALKKKHQGVPLQKIKPSSHSVQVIAVIDKVKLHRDRKGKQMAFLRLSDETEAMDAVVFASVFEKLEKPLQSGDIVGLKASMKEEGSLIVQEVSVFEKV